MASIEKKKNPTTGTVTYRAYVQMTNADGKLVKRSKQSRSKKVVEQWMVTEEKKLAALRNADTSIRVYDALQRFIDEVTPGFKGPQNSINLCKRLQECSIAEVLVVDLEHDDVKNLVKTMQGTGLKDSSIRRYIAVFKTAIGHCMDWYKIPYPLKGLKLKLQPNEEREYLISDAEIEGLRRAANYTLGDKPKYKIQRAFLMFLFAIDTGMRLNEIVHLNWKMITLGDIPIAALPRGLPKNSHPRNVPIQERGMMCINAMGVTDPDMPIFAGTDMFHWSGTFGKLRNKAGYENGENGGFTFHDARHRFCTEKAQIPGVGQLELAQVIGHRNPQQLSTYFNAEAKSIGNKFRVHEATLADGALSAFMKSNNLSYEEMMTQLQKQEQEQA